MGPIGACNRGGGDSEREQGERGTGKDKELENDVRAEDTVGKSVKRIKAWFMVFLELPVADVALCPKAQSRFVLEARHIRLFAGANRCTGRNDGKSGGHRRLYEAEVIVVAVCRGLTEKLCRRAAKVPIPQVWRAID